MMFCRATSASSGSWNVVTKDERLSIGLASVHASLLTMFAAARGVMGWSGKFSGTFRLNWSRIPAGTVAGAGATRDFGAEIRFRARVTRGNLALGFIKFGWVWFSFR